METCYGAGDGLLARRSAAFMPLQRGQHFDVRLLAGRVGVKRRERRARLLLAHLSTAWCRLRRTENFQTR